MPPGAERAQRIEDDRDIDRFLHERTGTGVSQPSAAKPMAKADSLMPTTMLSTAMRARGAR